MLSTNCLCHSCSGISSTSSITWEGDIEWICSAEKVVALLSINYLTFLRAFADDLGILTADVAVEYRSYYYIRGIVIGINRLPHSFHIVTTLAAYAGCGRW